MSVKEKNRFKSILTLLFVIIISSVSCSFGYFDQKGFDDSIIFKIDWPADVLDFPADGESIYISTHNNENYKCMLPILTDREKLAGEKYNGPNPLELLSPLFIQTACSYRLESYWTIEVCHGKYVRQYHEERDGKKVKLQEYFLGKWDRSMFEKLENQINMDKELGYTKPLEYKKMDGLNLPYLQMNFTDGTMCELIGRPRITNVLYVCYNHGKHEIYSFKETSTCEYEIIVLSALLCLHPKYRPQESGERPIFCVPQTGHPRKPKNLRALEAESIKLKHQRIIEQDTLKKLFAVLTAEKFINEGSETKVRVELKPGENSIKFEMKPYESSSDSLGISTDKDIPKTVISATPDKAALLSFLSGETCLYGGSGWWKYEFCYGKYVEQFHVEKDGNRRVVRLGTFDKAAHIKWLEKNPHKRPKPLSSRNFVTLFYGEGSTCDKTGKPRETEVKLKCVHTESHSSVSIYLLEPYTCQYILGVDSSIICDILPHVGEDGLIPDGIFDTDTVITSTDDDDDAEEINEITRDEL